MKILLLTFLILVGVEKQTEWIKTGSQADSYEIGTVEENDNAIAYIQSVKPKIEGTGVMVQWLSSELYQGKRVKLTAKIKTEDVEDWCGLWFRVDDVKTDGTFQPVSFDNMKKLINERIRRY